MRRVRTSLAKRLVSFATALAVSGSPTVLSACMALCLQAGPVAAMPMEWACGCATKSAVSSRPTSALVWNRKFFSAADFAEAAGDRTSGARLAVEREVLDIGTQSGSLAPRVGHDAVLV